MIGYDGMRAWLDARDRSEKVKASEVRPYEWALWCSIGDGEPFSNVIVAVEWSDDWSKLLFMLDTHNFFSAAPEEELELVRLEPNKSTEFLKDSHRAHANLIASRPSSEVVRLRKALLDAKGLIEAALKTE